MTRWLPRCDLARWTGSAEFDDKDVHGWSWCFQWGPVMIELCWGRVR